MESKGKNAVAWMRRYLSLPTVLVMGVVLYLAIFSETSISQAAHYRRLIDSLESEIRDNRDSMEYYEKLNRRLSSEPEMLERVVREHYNMQRPDEDVYIVE